LPVASPSRIAALLIAFVPAAAWAGRVEGTVSGLADPDGAVVYVNQAPGRFPPPAQPPVIEQRGLKFIPHVLPVVLGTRVRFPNNDNTRHNVFSASVAKTFNFGIYPPGGANEITFDKLGQVTLLCSIHENMFGYVLVLQNPYFALVGKDGRYVIDGVPDGSYSVTLWHEKLPAPATRTVVVKGAKVQLDFNAGGK
jgi:plastocyanin